jgi:uncharacterized protein YndB with AHSA1/START domain
VDPHANSIIWVRSAERGPNWSSPATQTLPSGTSDWSAANRFDWSLTRAPNQAVICPMEIPSAHHGTLVFERRIPGSVEAVFHAFMDPIQRAAWGAPSDTAVILYDSADFRPGGVDRFRCGSRSNPNVCGTTWYLQILENSRIVSAELIEMDGKPLSTSLTTLELRPDGQFTQLKSTSQIVSFVGSEMIGNHQIGNDGALDNLVRHFARQKMSPTADDMEFPQP